MLTRTAPSPGCFQQPRTTAERIIGRAMAATTLPHLRRFRRAFQASKRRMLTTSTQSEPPNTPVYSYHCTAQTSCEKPFPRMSHGQEKSPTVYQYSVVIHAATSVTYASALWARFETVWKSMNAIRLRVVEASVAATGPTGVAYQIHQTVSAFHRTNARVAHPNMRHQSRREGPYESLIHSRGTKPAKSVMPESPSQPGASRMAERITAANLRNMEGDFYDRKSSQTRAYFKIFPTFVVQRTKLSEQ